MQAPLVGVYIQGVTCEPWEKCYRERNFEAAKVRKVSVMHMVHKNLRINLTMVHKNFSKKILNRDAHR